MPSLCLKLSRLYLGFILRFDLSGYGLVLYVCTLLALLSDSEIKLFQPELAEKRSAHSLGNRKCFTETAQV